MACKWVSGLNKCKAWSCSSPVLPTIKTEDMTVWGEGEPGGDGDQLVGGESWERCRAVQTLGIGLMADGTQSVKTGLTSRCYHQVNGQPYTQIIHTEFLHPT